MQCIKTFLSFLAVLLPSLFFPDGCFLALYIIIMFISPYLLFEYKLDSWIEKISITFGVGLLILLFVFLNFRIALNEIIKAVPNSAVLKFIESIDCDALSCVISILMVVALFYITTSTYYTYFINCKKMLSK